MAKMRGFWVSSNIAPMRCGFSKMTGDAELVEQQKPAFIASLNR